MFWTAEKQGDEPHKIELLAIFEPAIVFKQCLHLLFLPNPHILYEKLYNTSNYFTLFLATGPGPRAENAHHEVGKWPA